jgi:aspartate/methionine/tyrosine aminotransferase
MNPRLASIATSLIRQVAAKRRPSSIDLGLGEPTLLPRKEHLERAMRYVTDHGIKYTANAGDPALRHAIAQYYAYPAMDRAANVCVTVGSQEAMFVAIKTLFDPARDEMLVVEPAFPSYVKMAALEGIGVSSVAMSHGNDFAFDADRIAAALNPRTRAIVICSPCNPTARVVSRDHAERLARVLERRSEPVWVIHDEIYREQLFVDDAGFFARCYPRTIVTNSLSKSNALTGLRLGWILAPAEFIEEAVKVHAWATSCADTFAQRTALAVFESTEGVREHARWYTEHHDRLLESLRDSGLQYVEPEGSFYVCVRLPHGTSSLDAANALIEEYDVVAIPGIAFGESLEGWLRLSWVGSADRVHEGLSRIAEYCANVIST